MSNDRPARGGGAASGSGRSARGGARPQSGGDNRARRARPSGSRPRNESDDAVRRRPRPDAPVVPDDITGRELDPRVLAQLAALPERVALQVARHLVMAGQLLDEDPEAAYQHARAAHARAARVAVVREATGEAAYAAGHFAEALAELRAAKRMNGAVDYLPMIADCERALGRPLRAVELAHSPAVARLAKDQRVEMRIVEAGARADLGEFDAALRVLESGPLHASTRGAEVVRLRYAYADLLLRAGRRGDALLWFHRTAGMDGEQITDAAERVLEIEGDTAGDSQGETADDPPRG